MGEFPETEVDVCGDTFLGEEGPTGVHVRCGVPDSALPSRGCGERGAAEGGGQHIDDDMVLQAREALVVARALAPSEAQHVGYQHPVALPEDELFPLLGGMDEGLFVRR